jgi:hypothetical protein
MMKEEGEQMTCKDCHDAATALASVEEENEQLRGDNDKLYALLDRALEVLEHWAVAPIFHNTNQPRPVYQTNDWACACDRATAAGAVLIRELQLLHELHARLAKA